MIFMYFRNTLDVATRDSGNLTFIKFIECKALATYHNPLLFLKMICVLHFSLPFATNLSVKFVENALVIVVFDLSVIFPNSLETF